MFVVVLSDSSCPPDLWRRLMAPSALIITCSGCCCLLLFFSFAFLVQLSVCMSTYTWVRWCVCTFWLSSSNNSTREYARATCTKISYSRDNDYQLSSVSKATGRFKRDPATCECAPCRPSGFFKRHLRATTDLMTILRRGQQRYQQQKNSKKMLARWSFQWSNENEKHHIELLIDIFSKGREGRLLRQVSRSDGAVSSRVQVHAWSTCILALSSCFL